MEIHTIEGFVSYYEKTRQITNGVINVIPKDNMDWAYMTGKFTIADLVRHLASIERNVFAETALGGKSRYKGCGKELADGYDNVIFYFNRMHEESINIFRSLHDASLNDMVRSVDGREIGLHSFLRALIVHEIHHRAALCIYLN
ncbi:MAG: DinB family protein, partial [Flavobacterium sp.]